jgi:hypothetical protein
MGRGNVGFSITALGVNENEVLFACGKIGKQGTTTTGL